MIPLADFQQTTFTYQEKTYPVYRQGNGPGVVIIHEIPGLTPKVADFGRYIAQQGFTVFLPSLFGTPGKPYSVPYVMQQTVRACIGREFHVLASGRSSPITDWLRALCRDIHDELDGPGVGALGMCLTGNFALSLMVDPVVMAPVLSQPSLPFGLTADHKKGLHVSADELQTIKERVANGTCVLGLRFTHDVLCPPERFAALSQELGDGFEGIEIDSGPGNAHGISRQAHSVLTEDLIDEEGHPTQVALHRVVAFFTERLRTS